MPSDHVADCLEAFRRGVRESASEISFEVQHRLKQVETIHPKVFEHPRVR
jgi:hypothetical protein